MTKLWGGRFEGAQDPVFESFHRSLPFDRRLWREDVRGSVAWAKALAGAGVLTDAEARQIVAALERIGSELEREPSLLERSKAEDVHSFVEERLNDLVGYLAKKLHTGRSRNDQVATDLRLFVKEEGARLDAALTSLMQALTELAERHAALPMPGYTHLQRAQPITVGHHALAYVEMLARDRSRLSDALARADECPLGSGALAGTAYRIDREALAEDLGFLEATRNSLDAVSDRDFACEIAFACSMAMVHLSRLAEDWIFFASAEAGFLELGDEVATGSSLMPQKRNPDGLELVRGKCGRVIGRLTGLLATLKGLPLAYDKDLQEDKEALFECVDTARACLEVAAVAVRTARFREERCREAAARGYLNATDLADLLVGKGVPFREAHERAGRVVRAAIESGVEIEGLPAAERKRLLPELAGVDLARELSVEAVLARRWAIGGTAPKCVLAEAHAWKARLAKDARSDAAISSSYAFDRRSDAAGRRNEAAAPAREPAARRNVAVTRRSDGASPQSDATARRSDTAGPRGDAAAPRSSAAPKKRSPRSGVAKSRAPAAVGSVAGSKKRAPALGTAAKKRRGK